MTYLFVGGPKDGEWIKTQDQPCFKVAVIPSIVSYHAEMEIDPKDMRFIAVEDSYIKRLFDTARFNSYLYVHESINPEDVFSMLVSGYRLQRTR